MGKTDILGLKIELEAGAVPRRSRVRPLYSDQRAYLKEQLNKWIQKGVMEPTNSPWASPLVPVKKKEGRDAYPLTKIQENLQKLKGAQIFISIDACGAYHCIQIEEERWGFPIYHHSECLLACERQAV